MGQDGCGILDRCVIMLLSDSATYKAIQEATALSNAYRPPGICWHTITLLGPHISSQLCRAPMFLGVGAVANGRSDLALLPRVLGVPQSMHVTVRIQ